MCLCTLLYPMSNQMLLFLLLLKKSKEQTVQRDVTALAVGSVVSSLALQSLLEELLLPRVFNGSLQNLL